MFVRFLPVASTFTAIALCRLRRHVGCFPAWCLHMAERRTGIGTRRESEGGRVAWFARARLLRRAVASMRASSCVNARFQSNRRDITESRLLLSPVMILPTSWFVWRFRSITGEIFFARNVLPRAGRFAGPNAGRSAGPESPVPENQVIDSARDFGTKIFRENPAAGVRGKETLR